MGEQKLNFQAEVSKLLEIVVNSLYSEKEIFLRELISNASDACDRLRYAALTEPSLNEGGVAFKISIAPDKAARTLTVADNGIGMNRDELIENLGTIAKSGTSAFFAQLSGDARKDMALIGQFGVGFYSAFMVAEKVEVFARKAGESQGWRWSSDGKGEFTVAEDAAAERGARVVLHLRAGEDEYLEPHRLRTIVKTYSDHIAIPVALIEEGKEETINAASALWTRPKSEITEDQYKEFYHHVGACLRRSVADHPLPRRGRDRIYRPAVRAVAPPLRPVRAGTQGASAPLCEARLHHRRQRGTAAALPALPARRGRHPGPAAQCQPRIAPDQPDARQDARRPDQAGAVRPEKEGRGRPRRLPRHLLGEFRRRAEGGASTRISSGATRSSISAVSPAPPATSRPASPTI